MITLLGLCVASAAYLIVRCLHLRRGAEVALASWCVASWLVLLPVHGLGLAGALTRASVMTATAVLCAGCFAIALAARRPRGVLADLHALLPSRDTLRLLVPRSAAWPLGLAVSVVLAHAVVATVLLPSEGWDGIWYHETLVGWTIQSGSYAPMPLPDNLLQQANGFPRNAEMMSVWLALLADRSLVELPNAIALVPMLLATHLIARRFVRRRWLAWSLACVVALAPGAILQLRSTYVDVVAAAAALAALHFATRLPLAPRDVALAGLAIGLSLGTKTSALLIAPLIAALLAVRCWPTLRAPHRPARHALAAAAIAGSFALGSLALVYGRNLLLFDNPLYPIAIDLPRLGVHLPGVRSAADVGVNAGLSDTLGSIFLPSASGRDFADIRRGGYGLAVAWLVFPLACWGLVMAARSARGDALGRRERAVRTRAQWLIGITLLILPSLLLSPALWSARYNLHAIGVLAAPAAYGLERLRPRLLRPALVFAAWALSVLAVLRFAPPLAEAPPSRLTSAWAMSSVERAAATRARWTIAPDVARAREAELGPGSVVVFGPAVSFPSLLYNERFDNQLEYVPQTEAGAIGARIAALQPTWIVASPAEPLHRYLVERPRTWQPIGLASQGQPTYAFRRISPAP